MTTIRFILWHFTILIAVFFRSESLLYAEPLKALPSPKHWNLPVQLNDQNTRISFEVDSTWHLVEGKTSGVSGAIWLADQGDPLSIRGDIKIPVARFNTDWESRDEELRHVMDIAHYPDVSFHLAGTQSLCKPDSLVEAASCTGELLGDLEIKSHRAPQAVGVQVRRDGDDFIVAGDFSINWSEFGVEDPSILIAKVQPQAKIMFEIILANDQEDGVKMK